MEINNGTYCVYVHVNKTNGKMYVGQTIYGNRPHKRWDNGNGYKNCPYFYNAIQKYGWDNFDHEVLANNLTAQEADNFETLLINILDTLDNNRGYNIEPGGVKNKSMSDATKKKLSEDRIGDKNPMYGVRLVGEKNGMYGKHHSDETKQKISEAQKGVKKKPLSQETKQKLSECAKERLVNPENNPMYGKRHTEESKKKMSESKKGEKSYNAKQIVQMDNDYNVIKIWGCIADAYRALNICRQSIPEVLNGEQHHAGGYRWAYLYDNIKKNGSIIVGAISLGYIAEEEIKNVKNTCV